MGKSPWSGRMVSGVAAGVGSVRSATGCRTGGISTTSATAPAATAWFFSHPKVAAAFSVIVQLTSYDPGGTSREAPLCAGPIGAVVLPGGKAAHNAPAKGCPARCAVIVSCVFAGGGGAAAAWGAFSVEWNCSICSTATCMLLPLPAETRNQVSTPSLVIVA